MERLLKQILTGLEIVLLAKLLEELWQVIFTADQAAREVTIPEAAWT